jgi:putative aminopeptidase FrvX
MPNTAEFAGKLREVLLENAERLGIEPTAEVLQETGADAVVAATTADGEDLFIEVHGA